MRKIIAANKPLRREVWSREQLISRWKQQGESFKAEWAAELPGDEPLTVTNVKTASGTRNGREWKAYFVSLSDGREAVTFHESTGAAAQSAKASGSTVAVQIEPSKKDPSKLELVALELLR